MRGGGGGGICARAGTCMCVCVSEREEYVFGERESVCIAFVRGVVIKSVPHEFFTSSVTGTIEKSPLMLEIIFE